MTKPMKVTCNESCHKTFTLTKFLTQKLDGGIEKVYFVCPHCQHEYVAYYTDAEIRGLQEQIRKVDGQAVKVQKRLSQKMFNQLTWQHTMLRKVIAEKMAGSLKGQKP